MVIAPSTHRRALLCVAVGQHGSSTDGHSARPRVSPVSARPVVRSGAACDTDGSDGARGLWFDSARNLLDEDEHARLVN